jgi:hypothetical protein
MEALRGIVMIVDGQKLSNSEVRRLLDMVRKDAQEYAGQFFDQCRSKKFRIAWTEVGLRAGRDPQMCFVDAQWGHFVEHVRMLYAQMLASPKISEPDKYRMHQALIVQAVLGQHSQNTPIQMAPGTQQFVGEKYENKHIAATFGEYAEPTLMHKLLSTTAVKQ